MNYAVAPGTSFCECAGRFIFLDLAVGRYFALGPDAESAFRELVDGGPSSPSHGEALARLSEQGLLVASNDRVSRSHVMTPVRPTRSLVDVQGAAGLVETSWALGRLISSRLALKRKPLVKVLSRLAARKAKRGLCSPPMDELIEIATAFRRCALIATPLDQCLPRSVAMAHMLLDRGYRTELVIGVRVQPFGAHCWLQLGDLLVNETVDEARNFTPILVI